MIQKLSNRVDNVNALQFFQLFRYGTLVLLGIFFAKIGVPKSSIALFENLLFISGLVSFFWVNGFIQLLLSEYPNQTQLEKQKTIFRYFITLQLFSALVATGIYTFLQSDQAPIIALFIFFNTPSLLNEYVLYLNDKRKTLIGYGIVTAILLIALIIGMVLFLVLAFDEPLDKIFGIVLIVFTAIAFLRWLFSLLLLSQFSTVDFSIIKGMNWPTALLLITGFLLSGSSEYISGWFVKHYFDTAAFTSFRYGTKELPLFTILAATLSNAMIAVIAKNETEGIATLKLRSLKQMHLFYPIAIFLAIGGPYLFQVIFSPLFYESGKLFSLTMLLTIPRLAFPQSILHAKAEQRWLTLAMVFEILVLVILSALLLPYFGLSGLILAIILSYSVEKLVLAAVLWLKFKIHPFDYISLNWYAFYSFLLILSVFLTNVIT